AVATHRPVAVAATIAAASVVARGPWGNKTRLRRRLRRRGRLQRQVSRPSLVGTYDGEAIDRQFGKEPVKALKRLVEVVSRINAARAAWQDESCDVALRGQRLRAEVAVLGPVFVKGAQTLATRSDIVSRELAKELGLLQAK
ncbi:unnamed protein product, partial [Polarella glacialis]